MPRLAVLLLAIMLAGCGVLAPNPEVGCPFGRGEVAYYTHTTLADAGLPAGDVRADRGGDLWVSAGLIELPHGAPDFSQPPSAWPTARMYCFHPDGSNETLLGALPNGWSPPDSH